MLTINDVMKRLDIDLDTAGYLYAKRIMPEGVKVGGVIRFRENDIKKFERYLINRSKCRAKGIDPDSAQGPAPPVYSTAGEPRYDPRLVIANEQEAERQKKSKTLKAGSAPIGPQEKITLPVLTTGKAKVEG